LPAPEMRPFAAAYRLLVLVERAIATVWQEVLHVKKERK